MAVGAAALELTLMLRSSPSLKHCRIIASQPRTIFSSMFSTSQNMAQHGPKSNSRSRKRDEAAEGGSGANKRGEALNKAGRVSVQPTGRTQRGGSDVGSSRWFCTAGGALEKRLRFHLTCR